MSLSAIDSATRKRVFQRDQGRCRYCRLSQVGQAATFHINHVIPRSAGGATIDSNLVLQCPYCSLHKSNKLTAKDPETGVDVSIFHPLRQSWEEHFALNGDGVSINAASGFDRCPPCS